MSQHHKSDIRLGYDAKVDHVYFDTTDEGTVEFGFRTKIGTRFDDKVFIYNNVWMSLNQAKELSEALITALAEYERAPQETSDYLEREQLLGSGVGA